jgi:hypothetical protein
LELHSGDWARYWSEFDRRQGDALDTKKMHELLAEQAARQAEVREEKVRKKRESRPR